MINSAFSYRNGSLIEVHDIRIGYERLFGQIFQSDAPEDQNLRSALSRILTSDLVNDVDGVITYVTIKQYTKEKKNIPLYMKTVYTVITNLSVIQGDGLYEWLMENKISTLHSLYIALKKMEQEKASQVVKELYDYIREFSNKTAFTGTLDQIINERIEEFERRLMDSFDNGDFTMVAEAYLRENKRQL